MKLKNIALLPLIYIAMQSSLSIASDDLSYKQKNLCVFTNGVEKCLDLEIPLSDSQSFIKDNTASSMVKSSPAAPMSSYPKVLKRDDLTPAKSYVDQKELANYINIIKDLQI